MSKLRIELIDGNAADFKKYIREQMPQVKIQETHELVEGATVRELVLLGIPAAIAIINLIRSYLKKRPNIKIKLTKTGPVISNADEEKYIQESIEASVEQ